VPRDIQEPVLDERGDETHPGFAVITIHDVSSTPGAVLFQSDVRHSRYIRLAIHHAVRKRDLKHDWVHAGKVIAEVEMSQSQWAAMVSSMGNGSGTPVTLSYTDVEGQIPGMPYQPRIAQSLEETREVVGELLARIEAAHADLEALETAKAGVKERREARSRLAAAIRNAKANAVFAVQSMNAQAEKTVAQAKSDIEVAVAQAAMKHQIETNQLELMGIDAPDALRAIGAAPFEQGSSDSARMGSEQDSF
jgi:hypothetical protein